MFDKAKALDNTYKKLQRQQETLKATLAEIEYISTHRPDLVSAINVLKTKRDRQTLAVKATEQLVDFYTKDNSEHTRAFGNTPATKKAR